jgi:hypothetical protein
MVAVFPGSQFTGGDAHNNKVYTINNAMFPGVAGVRMTSESIDVAHRGNLHDSVRVPLIPARNE